MLKDGSMEIQMSQAVAGIKGTTIVCEETGSSSILKVLTGTASLKSRATGEETLVHAGEMATATTSGLSSQKSFDVETEKAIWEPYHSKTEVIEPEESEVIYNSWNKGSVDNKPTCSPFFTIDKPQMITYIDTYHWNHGTDAPGGTISLRNGYGKLYGPWEVETSLDQARCPKATGLSIPMKSYWQAPIQSKTRTRLHGLKTPNRPADSPRLKDMLQQQMLPKRLMLLGQA